MMTARPRSRAKRASEFELLTEAVAAKLGEDPSKYTMFHQMQQLIASSATPAQIRFSLTPASYQQAANELGMNCTLKCATGCSPQCHTYAEGSSTHVRRLVHQIAVLLDASWTVTKEIESPAGVRYPTTIGVLCTPHPSVQRVEQIRQAFDPSRLLSRVMLGKPMGNPRMQLPGHHKLQLASRGVRLEATAVLRQYKHLLEQAEEVNGRLAEAKLIKAQRWGAPHGTALHHSELQLHKLSADKKRLAKQLSETETLLSQLRDEAATATCAAILLD